MYYDTSLHNLLQGDIIDFDCTFIFSKGDIIFHETREI